MSRGKELLKNTAILMIAKISTQFISFILLPLYTAILSTEEYGQVDVYTSLSMLIIPFVTLQIEMGLFRYYISEEQRNNRKEIISSSLVVVCANVAVATVVYFLINIIVNIPYRGYLYVYYLALTLHTVLLQVCRAKGDNLGYAFASFLGAALTVVLNVIFIAWVRMGVSGILLSSIIAHIVSCLFMIIRTKVLLEFRWRCVTKQRIEQLVHYSFPLVFNQISSWAINYSDRFIILFYLGQSFNGIYSIACKFSNIMNTFFGVYNVAWTENVIRSLDDRDGDKYICRVFELTFCIYTITVSGILNVLPFVFRTFINEKFWDSYGHIPILLVGMLFCGMSSTIGSIYIACNETRNVSLTTFMAGITNIVVHFGLIKTCGLYAASISTLVSFCALFVYRILFVRRFFPLIIRKKRIVLYLFVLLYASLAYYTKSMILVVIGLIVTLCGLFVLLNMNKDLIISLYVKSRKLRS